MANLNRYNKKREEMIEIRRKKAGLEEIQEEKREILVPTTLKGKWENFLYHYKKIMFAMMFLIIVGVVCIASFFLREQYDLSVIVISKNTYAGADALFVPSLRGFATDVNGNGTVELEFASYQVVSEGESASDMTAMTFTQIIGRLSECRDYLFLLDETGYENLKSIEVEFVPISSFAGCEGMEGDKYYLKDKDIRKKIGLNEGLDNMFFCFVDINSYEASSINEEKQKIHDAQWAMLEGIIAFE